MRKPLVAGNWKMNGLGIQLAELSAVREAAERGETDGVDVLLCVPATILSAARDAAKGRIAVGGQDCHAKASGAHTGDVSAEMLADAGADFVIVGHSERRSDHREDDAMVRAKLEAGARAGLRVVVCVGETQESRDEGRTLADLERQLHGSLPDRVDAHRVAVAYEPVWAIGTGRTPTPDEVAEVHAFLRRQLADRFGQTAADGIRLLYGGSVNPKNAAELIALPHVDGALVGGASLKAMDFLAIVSAAVRSTRGAGDLE